MLNISPQIARNNLKITARARPEKPVPSPTLVRGATLADTINLWQLGASPLKPKTMPFSLNREESTDCA